MGLRSVVEVTFARCRGVWDRSLAGSDEQPQQGSKIKMMTRIDCQERKYLEAGAALILRFFIRART
jgi:hypothetical protein